MITTLIEPLRNKNTNGMLYTRPAEVESKLLEIKLLPRDEIAARCSIRDPKNPNYLPSECLVYLVRENRTESMDDCAELLFKTLLQRVLSGLLSGESKDGNYVRAKHANIRDELRFRFLELLMRDRSEYETRLDIYEIRFAKALCALRVNVQRKLIQQEEPLESIEIDGETGEIAEQVERAAGSFNPFEDNQIDNVSHRIQLDEAIDSLPSLQKAIIEMDRKKIPIESKEPDAVTISSALRKTPKTIRKHRDLAYATLRKLLMKGEN